MSTSPSFPKLDIPFLVNVAANALMDVAARDDLYLKPKTITQAAQARALRGVRAVEAFLRRLLIALALQFEHEIEVDVTARPYPKTAKPAPTRLPQDGLGSLRILLDERPLPNDFDQRMQRLNDKVRHTQIEPRMGRGGERPSGPILQRLERAGLILQTVEARARRLAFTLARHRHGPLTPPLPDTVPNRMGTAFASVYPTLGYAVYERSRHRPPPERPRPPPRPRIRTV